MKQAVKEKVMIAVLWVFASLFLALCIVCFVRFRPTTVSFIDIGQGDACLIRAGREGNVLIDSGDEGSGTVLRNYFRLQNMRELDAVFLSHFHADHVTGVMELMESGFPIKKIYIAAYTGTPELEPLVLNLAEEKHIPVQRLAAGETVSCGDARYEVLSPSREIADDNLNNSSMILRMECKNTSFLFTGDAERDTEQAILARGTDVHSTVLKVGHHGSDTSTGYLWLREVDPEYAVISVGKGNSYGHPTEAVLSRLRDAEVTTFRTDMQGDITCTSDGMKVTFSVSRNADANVFGSIGPNSTQKETQVPKNDAATAVQPVGQSYILNTNTKKFHYPSCGSVRQMKDSNKQFYTGSRNDVIAKGYVPCKKCNP